MKKDNIIYWVTTGLIGAMMLFSAYNYFTNAEMKSAFVHLGFQIGRASCRERVLASV